MPVIYQKVPFEQMDPEEIGRNVRKDGEQALFYCPVYEGYIERYDCTEIRFGINHGYFYNDGIPFLMDIRVARSEGARCFNCIRSRRTPDFT